MKPRLPFKSLLPALVLAGLLFARCAPGPAPDPAGLQAAAVLETSLPSPTTGLASPSPAPAKTAAPSPEATLRPTARPTPLESTDPALESLTRHEPAGCPQGCRVHITGCDIKGNISISSGNKIYHLPGGEFYAKTVISPEYGERWFCSEAEAQANGWRPPRTYP